MLGNNRSLLILLSLVLLLLSCLILTSAHQYFDDDAPRWNSQRDVPDDELDDLDWENAGESNEEVDIDIGEHQSPLHDTHEYEINGQAAGVDVDSKFIHVFHRGSRKWDFDSFDEKDNFLKRKDGPIKEATVTRIDRQTRKRVASSGSNMFYMPHGLTLAQDENHNLWLTDVAMHQVFKYDPAKNEIILTLGKAFDPARSDDDEGRFCKPTDVAVAKNGDIFVSDGYCRSRVMKFSSDGKLKQIFGKGDFNVAHSLTLLEDEGLVCVANREGKEIRCYDMEKFNLVHHHLIGDRVFAVAYNKTGKLLHAVSDYAGYTLDCSNDNGDIIDVWTPEHHDFGSPHDLAIAPDDKHLFVSEIGPNRVTEFSSKIQSDK